MTAPTAGPIAIRYTFIAGDGVAEVRTHPVRDAEHGANQLAAAIELQARQGGRFDDAELIYPAAPAAVPAPRRHTLADALSVEASSFFRSLARLDGALTSR